VVTTEETVEIRSHQQYNTAAVSSSATNMVVSYDNINKHTTYIIREWPLNWPEQSSARHIGGARFVGQEMFVGIEYVLQMYSTR